MVSNKAIAFRPKLEGEFRTRFYTAVQNVSEKTSTNELEQLVTREVNWVEHECTVNLVQRKKYRAVWMLLRDLIRASWPATFAEVEKTLIIRYPIASAPTDTIAIAASPFIFVF